VLLEHQDRRQWDAALIERAALRLRAAVRQGRPGPYQVQAGIAALHALAVSYEKTNWADVRSLYDRLCALDPSPVVLLNRAVTTRFAIGPAEALTEVDALRDRLEGYHLWYAARADLLAALDRPAEALVAAGRALELTTNPAERELMSRRIGELRRPAR
jgi:RNA polymerase sigma-70 factor (ECF subfamily)